MKLSWSILKQVRRRQSAAGSLGCFLCENRYGSILEFGSSAGPRRHLCQERTRRRFRKIGMAAENVVDQVWSIGPTEGHFDRLKMLNWQCMDALAWNCTIREPERKKAGIHSFE